MDAKIGKEAPGPEWYRDATGYDCGFLGVRIDLPVLSPAHLAEAAPLNDDSGHELKYTHFSVVMNKSRALAFFTAVNIDGRDIRELHRDADVWYFDPRIERKYQMDPHVYDHPDLDRGHLVRRLDPVWGEAANKANEDTFHFTNCSPQHSKLNRKTWLNLERYILQKADVHDLKVSVFTGPVFRDDDKIYLDRYAIPAEFWKVVAMVKTDGSLSTTAYLQSQRQLIAGLREFAYGQYKTYQVRVADIEALTGLNFGQLRDHDPLAMAGTRRIATAVVIASADDIVL